MAIATGFLVRWMTRPCGSPSPLRFLQLRRAPNQIEVPAIATKVPLPVRLMHILNGGSLLNDASGLIQVQLQMDNEIASSLCAYDKCI